MNNNQSTVSQPIIDLQNVSVGYERSGDVLQNVYFSLLPGSFTFITGKSGAGKTTLLNMLYLVKKPNKGILKVFGNNINFSNRDTLAELRQKIGVVFQNFRLLEHLSVFDNIALPLRVRGMGEKEIYKRVTELLQWVELHKSIYKVCSSLSGGEKQRVAIARAVINRPEILFADEPTGSVDSEIAGKLMRLFVELNKVGTTVVLATHNEQLTSSYNYPRITLADGSAKLYPALKRI
ncbi:MAG: ATP-binding cassette domain-containing protein [Alphaproteobacteria bacterium]|nr:ATP-binding cassette domain-containing protein [Alphaproteobacteria bacterium]